MFNKFKTLAKTFETEKKGFVVIILIGQKLDQTERKPNVQKIRIAWHVTQLLSQTKIFL